MMAHQNFMTKIEAVQSFDDINFIALYNTSSDYQFYSFQTQNQLKIHSNRII